MTTAEAEAAVGNFPTPERDVISFNLGSERSTKVKMRRRVITIFSWKEKMI